MAEIAAVSVAAEGDGDGRLLAAGTFEGEAPALALDGAARERLGRLAGRAGFSGRDDQRVESDGGDGSLVALYGLGKRHEFSVVQLGRFISRLADDLRRGRHGAVRIALPEHAETAGSDAAARRVLRLLALSAYRYDTHKTDAEPPVPLGEIEVVPPPGQQAAYRAALAGAQTVAEAVAFSRTIANAPANVASPAWMEERARELAESRGLEATVLGEAELKTMGMGGLLGVGQGSAVPPRLVRLSWGDRGPVVALVGKGVTFDTGGISIKPAAEMDQMKFDKCGACAVLGIARAVVDLGLPIRLRAYTPLAENMLSGRAYRPGDILKCYNGKTVEITNTDAEGRLILADALSWAAAADEKPDHLVEYSTLTGSCVVALGHQAAGLFTPSGHLAAQLLAAAEASGERLWRLPMWPEFLEDMQGTHADLQNSGSRWGGASTAAAFLSQFVGDLSSWAHLDIAGVAYHRQESDRPGCTATGYGVATTVDWLRRLTA